MGEKYSGSDLLDTVKKEAKKYIHNLYKPSRIVGGIFMYLNGIVTIILVKIFINAFNSNNIGDCIILIFIGSISIALFRMGHNLFQAGYRIIGDIDNNNFYYYDTCILDKINDIKVLSKIGKEKKELIVRPAEYDNLNVNDKVFIFYIGKDLKQFIIKQ